MKFKKVDDISNHESTLKLSQGTEREIWIINKNIENLKATNNKEELKKCDIEGPKKYDVQEPEDKYDIEESGVATLRTAYFSRVRSQLHYCIM